MANRPMRVLIVDDDPTLREMYEARLKNEHFETILAHDGQEALARATEDNPDIILLDLRMPNITGLEVLEILKTTKDTKTIPVIVLTAFNDDQLRQDATARGAAAYLVKSETMPADVLAKIQEITKVP